MARLLRDKNVWTVIKLEHFGKIEGGKLVLHNPKRLADDLRLCKDLEVIVTIKKRGSKSMAQQGYLFGVIYQECRLAFINLGTRMTLEQVHQFFKAMFIPENIVDANGTIIGTWEGTTTDFNKPEMSDYMDQIIQWAAENLQIIIPPPDKNKTLF